MEKFDLENLIQDPMALAQAREYINEARENLESAFIHYKFLWQVMGEKYPEPSKEALILLMQNVWKHKITGNETGIALVLSILIAERVTND